MEVSVDVGTVRTVSLKTGGLYLWSLRTKYEGISEQVLFVWLSEPSSTSCGIWVQADCRNVSLGACSQAPQEVPSKALGPGEDHTWTCVDQPQTEAAPDFCPKSWALAALWHANIINLLMMSWEGENTINGTQGLQGLWNQRVGTAGNISWPKEGPWWEDRAEV